MSIGYDLGFDLLIKNIVVGLQEEVTAGY